MRYLDGVFLTGGVMATSQSGGIVKSDVNFFNLTSSAWQNIPPMNYNRHDHILVPVDGVPTVIGGLGQHYSEQLREGSWKTWLEHNPAYAMSALQVDSDEFSC